MGKIPKVAVCATVVWVLLLFGNSGLSQEKSGGSKEKETPLPQNVSLLGSYSLTGTDPEGGKYQGYATFNPAKGADVYRVTWLLENGVSYSGIAIRSKEQLAIAWALPVEQVQVRGLNMYRISVVDGKPALSGRWATLPGNGRLGSEKLKLEKARSEELQSDE